MKKIFFALVALICSMSTNAQIMKIMKDGKLVATYKASQANQVVFEDTPSGEHEYVDLGLPSGLKWAICNIGADNPEDYGYYFAWGETAQKSTYDYYTYKWCKISDDGETIIFTKYCTNSDYGIVDNKTVLDPEDDAAHVNWGGNWRMPTEDELDELLSNCYCEWVTSYNGKSVSGYIVYKAKDPADKGNYSSSYSPVGSYSVSDPHLFLPAAGGRWAGELEDAGSNGYYWSSSLYPRYSNFGRFLGFDSRDWDWYISERNGGLSVRAVCP